jgi:hypothetical protein
VAAVVLSDPGTNCCSVSPTSLHMPSATDYLSTAGRHGGYGCSYLSARAKALRFVEYTG